MHVCMHFWMHTCFLFFFLDILCYEFIFDKKISNMGIKTCNRVIRDGRSSDSYKVKTTGVTVNDTLIVTIKKDNDDEFCLIYQIEGFEVANKNSVHFKPWGNDVRWSGCTAKRINKIDTQKSCTIESINMKKDVAKNSTNKLEPIGRLVLDILQEDDLNKCQYEASPDWLVATPSMEQIRKYPIIKDIHSSLTNNKVNYTDEDSKNKKQKFDIWIGEPYNFAIEFDEEQHLNSFRRQTLELYKGFYVGFSINNYLSLCKKTIKPGTSGFTKLKSPDKLFPPMYDGNNQDNRVRQRAFRDFLKDYLPIINGFQPTIRIPYTLVNKTKDFSPSDLDEIKNYLKKYIQKNNLFSFVSRPFD